MSHKTFGYEYIKCGLFLLWQANVIKMMILSVGIYKLKRKNADNAKLTTIIQCQFVVTTQIDYTVFSKCKISQ